MLITFISHLNSSFLNLFYLFDTMDPNFVLNLDGPQDYQNFQGYESSQIFPNLNQFPKNPRGDKWDADEDITLMSAYCIVSEYKRHGKNQKKTSIWAQVGVNREAYRKRRIGMSMKDVENEAHKLYETSGSKFNDTILFNEVMCKHRKWDLQLDHDATRSHPKYEVDDEESGGSTKRSRSTKEGDYCVQSNTEGASIGGSTIKRPTGRDAAKRKEKGKSLIEVVAEICVMRLSRDSEVEVMKKKRLGLDQQREQKTDERELIKMQSLHLNTLLQKEQLSPEEENMKQLLNELEALDSSSRFESWIRDFSHLLNESRALDSVSRSVRVNL
uniref:No apical meristem-associated C-terminal domain-containing protein n=1 Tax=Lactuca sativa TaxID=4236 RepID=A0A9R1VIK4_LACSA|nr:hypothetical protein LSAT_V11C500278470 [Lactuca sativa]